MAVLKMEQNSTANQLSCLRIKDVCFEYTGVYACWNWTDSWRESCSTQGDYSPRH